MRPSEVGFFRFTSSSIQLPSGQHKKSYGKIHHVEWETLNNFDWAISIIFEVPKGNHHVEGVNKLSKKMAIFRSKLCEFRGYGASLRIHDFYGLNTTKSHGKPPFSYGFPICSPMFLAEFSRYVPLNFHGFPMKNGDFPMVFLWFSYEKC